MGPVLFAHTLAPLSKWTRPDYDNVAYDGVQYLPIWLDLTLKMGVCGEVSADLPAVFFIFVILDLSWNTSDKYKCKIIEINVIIVNIKMLMLSLVNQRSILCQQRRVANLTRITLFVSVSQVFRGKIMVTTITLMKMTRIRTTLTMMMIGNEDWGERNCLLCLLFGKYQWQLRGRSSW